jgi:hypothetical protein
MAVPSRTVLGHTGIPGSQLSSLLPFLHLGLLISFAPHIDITKKGLEQHLQAKQDGRRGTHRPPSALNSSWM